MLLLVCVPMTTMSQSGLPRCTDYNPFGMNGACQREFEIGDGTKYVGEYAGGTKSGYGILYNKYGSVQSAGYWVNGVFVGQQKPPTNQSVLGYGNFFSSLPRCTESNPFGMNGACQREFEVGNGTKYVGEYAGGTKNGFGMLLSPSGSVINIGNWVDGKFQPANLNSAANATTAGTTELERLRHDLEESKRKQLEAETQLRVIQQVSLPSTSQPVVAGSNGKRVALVIGNSNYRTRPLRNPINDANDVSSALRTSGFQVIDLRDASLQQMRAGVRQFGDRLINNDVGLVYYSGHGVEVKGRNYFIPVNADIQREDEIADQGLDVSLVLEKMNTAGKGVNILIVDACRDDPFGRSFRSASRGLAQMDAPRGTIIAYATSPGKVAQDGDGRNSPYTKNLVRVMQQPNKPIEQVFKEVRRAVQEETKNQQTPWENTSLSGDFYFRVQR
jgi:hypothetical protein